MSLRSIPPEMNAEMIARIDAMLDRVAEEYRVFLPLAIESGSRAWGFSSPDSDYDCRFVFVRRVIDHITPWTARDVIELPLEGEMDANGWDLRKAIQLLLKGNAVIVEWLCSPVIYRGQAWFRDGFLEFAQRATSREAIRRHYLHLGERQRRHLQHRDEKRSVPRDYQTHHTDRLQLGEGVVLLVVAEQAVGDEVRRLAVDLSDPSGVVDQHLVGDLDDLLGGHRVHAVVAGLDLGQFPGARLDDLGGAEQHVRPVRGRHSSQVSPSPAPRMR